MPPPQDKGAVAHSPLQVCLFTDQKQCDGGKPCTRCTEADDVCEYMKCSKKESKEYPQELVNPHLLNAQLLIVLQLCRAVIGTE
jgi:hypothetical protein